MALTSNEINQHFARMLRFAMNQIINPQNKRQVKTGEMLMHWFRRFKEESSYGTEAERQEARHAFRDLMYVATTGRAVGDGHDMEDHWHRDAEIE